MALGRSPEENVKGHSGAIYRGPYTGVQKFLYTIEIIAFFNTKHLISRQQTNWSR